MAFVFGLYDTVRDRASFGHDHHCTFLSVFLFVGQVNNMDAVHKASRTETSSLKSRIKNQKHRESKEIFSSSWPSLEVASGNTSLLALTDWETECARTWFEKSFPSISVGPKLESSREFAEFLSEIGRRKKKIPLWKTPALTRDYLHLAGVILQNKLGLNMVRNISSPLLVRIDDFAKENPPTTTSKRAEIEEDPKDKRNEDFQAC